jgi:hypothetical protein
MRGEALGEIERRGSADIVLQVTVHLGLEGGILLRRVVRLLQVEDQRHQGLGDEAPAIEAEAPALVGAGAEGIRLLLDGHIFILPAFRRQAKRAPHG